MASVASRGSLNAVLNRLVRQRVITAFRTNLGDRDATDMQVVISADLEASPRSALDEKRREQIRQHVARELEPLALAVTVITEPPG